MPTLLAVTVGGACTPIVTAIRDYSADHVCFIASAGPKGSLAAVQGEGDPCGDKRQIRCPHCGKPVALGDPHGPNIIAQAGLRPDQYTLVEVADPDSLSDCYRQIRAALESAAASRPDWRRLADYTGGTKTMTIALANAALELGWELSAVKGTRADLIKVLDGSEMAGLVNVADLRAQQRLAEARRLFNSFAYEAAGEQLESLLR